MKRKANTTHCACDLTSTSTPCSACVHSCRPEGDGRAVPDGPGQHEQPHARKFPKVSLSLSHCFGVLSGQSPIYRPLNLVSVNCTFVYIRLEGRVKGGVKGGGGEKILH